MKNPMIYINNSIKKFGIKLRYGNRVRMGWIQSFERIRIEIKKEGSLVMGSYNQNRGLMYVGVLDKGLLTIGSHCFFNINSSITCAEKITIGDNCKFGNNLVIVDHDHNYRAEGSYSVENPEFVSSPIVIGNNVWVGANVTILRGSVIGDNCVIAAGSIVYGNVPKETIYMQKRVSELRGIKNERNK